MLSQKLSISVYSIHRFFFFKVVKKLVLFVFVSYLRNPENALQVTCTFVMCIYKKILSQSK